MHARQEIRDLAGANGLDHIRVTDAGPKDGATDFVATGNEVYAAFRHGTVSGG